MITFIISTHIAVVAETTLPGKRVVAHKETIKQKLWIKFKINVVLMLYRIRGATDPEQVPASKQPLIYGVTTARKAVLVQKS